ncbi:MAG: SpoIVB peptidase S55 domain-containing protein [Acidobacteriota bacterium]
MNLRQFGHTWALIFLVTLPLFGQSVEFYPLESIQPGQTGYGKTVFEGTRVDTFQVEILGVLKNVGPKQNMILARLSGGPIARTGVFAGMSGSPVYIEDKLIGAVAYAFPFATEPFAGITPIREMVDIFKEKPESGPRRARRVNPDKMYDVAQLPSFLSHFELPQFFVEPSLTRWQDLGRLQPIATPLNLSGFSPRSIQQFSSQLELLGLVPVRGMGTARMEAYEDVPLQAGSTITVQLVRGDIEVSASGTATHIEGDRIYGFGHPFLSVGTTDLPLNKGAVLTIIPNLMTSEKVSATLEPIGSIKQDRATGIMGVAGEEAQLIPVRLRLHTSRNEVKELNFEVVTDNFLTPFLMSFTVHSSIVSSERSIGDQTIQVKCTISIKGQSDVNFESSVSDLVSSPVFAALAAASPVNFLLNSGFEELVMEKIDVEITAVEQTREATVETIWQDRLEVDPGEEVHLTVFLRQSNGDTIIKKYPVKIPEEITPGPLKIVVADGMSLTREDAETGVGEFIPESLPQLIKAINNLKKNDRLYIRLVREQAGAIISGEGMPDLPPSLLALYGSRKTSGELKSMGEVIYVEHELPATEFVLNGRQEISVNVK